MLKQFFKDIHKSGSDSRLFLNDLGIDIEGGSSPDKRTLLACLVVMTKSMLVYETGFNAGGSAIAICEALKFQGAGKYVGFELREELKPAFVRISSMYPGTMELEWGDSRQTLPARLARTKEHPDLFFIDGGHSHEVVVADFEEALKCVRPGGLVVFDDADALRPSISSVVPEKDLIWLNSTNPYDAGLAIYQIKG